MHCSFSIPFTILMTLSPSPSASVTVLESTNTLGSRHRSGAHLAAPRRPHPFQSLTVCSRVLPRLQNSLTKKEYSRVVTLSPWRPRHDLASDRILAVEMFYPNPTLAFGAPFQPGSARSE